MAARDESEEPTLDGAAAGLDDALARLERAVRATGQRLEEADALENEAKRLANDRAQLSHALDMMTARANKLDRTADEVSTRLMAAMEKVRLALSKQEG